MPIWSTMTNQNSVSPMMENLSFLHDHLMIMMILIMISSGITSLATATQKSFHRDNKENHELEIFWSSLPAIILIVIAIPSLGILYLMEESSETNLTTKINAHQWYWSYEYPDMDLSIDSYLSNNQPRNLMASNHLILPYGTPIRFLVTSSDVIHSWTIPSMGVKMDAMPGRINQFQSIILKPGMLTGQCSEICGMNHSFMPITISSITPTSFMNSMSKLMEMKINSSTS